MVLGCCNAGDEFDISGPFVIAYCKLHASLGSANHSHDVADNAYFPLNKQHVNHHPFLNIPIPPPFTYLQIPMVQDMNRLA